MNISIILCTYNRSDSLRKTLESLAAQSTPPGWQWETLIVDNNSKDQTGATAKEYCRKYPGRFRYALERKQGKSHALNTGIREAKGALLAFIDDDVLAEPDWLSKLSAPLLDPLWAGVGGRIAPPTDFSPPHWLLLDGPCSMAGILALFDKGPKGAELFEPAFGTNMAFRREVFEKLGLFRTDLGPCPGSEIRGEDTEFGRRVLKAGERIWYEPSAVVHHAVGESRLQKDYFLRFQFDQGRAEIREKDLTAPVWFIPRCYVAFPKIVQSVLLSRLIRWLIATDPKLRFQRKCMVWNVLGQLSELRDKMRAGKVSWRTQPPGLETGTENRA